MVRHPISQEGMEDEFEETMGILIHDLVEIKLLTIICPLPPTGGEPLLDIERLFDSLPPHLIVRVRQERRWRRWQSI
jgi:hypothetical protein